jgi:transcription initiation factor IIE alpha subunit
MQQFGGWFTNTKPAWEERLENTSNYVLEKTGMNRNELKKLLTYLDEQGIIR